jgi:hypothetical protein
MWKIFWLINIAAVIYAVLTISQTKIKTADKVIWILVVLLIPYLGVIVWYFAGPKK